MRNVRRLQIALAVVAVALLAYAYAVRAGCRSDGGCAARTGAAQRPKTCGPGCKKPCCGDKKAAGRKTCGPGCAKACCAAKTTDRPEATLGTGALKVLLGAKTPLVLLDARAGTKWDDGQRIPGAKSLGLKASPDTAAAVIGSKDTLIVTYCGSRKCPLSRLLARRLQQLGYRHVLEYPEGIKGWLGTGNQAALAVHPKCLAKIDQALGTGDFRPVASCGKTSAALEALTVSQPDFDAKCRAKVLKAIKTRDFGPVTACQTTTGEIRKAVAAYKARSK